MSTLAVTSICPIEACGLAMAPATKLNAPTTALAAPAFSRSLSIAMDAETG
jgi:hypothetical protein